jgi:hypothetical protein
MGMHSDVAFIDKPLRISVSLLHQSYRNAFRRDRDYSILYFLLAWGLQVADATVWAHLKQFDVSNDLSLESKARSQFPNPQPGLGLTLNMKNHPSRKSTRRTFRVIVIGIGLLCDGQHFS